MAACTETFLSLVVMTQFLVSQCCNRNPALSCADQAFRREWNLAQDAGSCHCRILDQHDDKNDYEYHIDLADLSSADCLTKGGNEKKPTTNPSSNSSDKEETGSAHGLDQIAQLQQRKVMTGSMSCRKIPIVPRWPVMDPHTHQ
jgi:hypothetical protein